MMLTRRHTLKGRGFQRKAPETIARERAATKAANIDMLLATTGRAAVMGGSTSGKTVDKENASQSGAYHTAVHALGFCMRCGCTLAKGIGQLCHRDQGKGQGIKTDIRGSWLGCPGCHHWLGMSGKAPKQLRRAIEDFLAWKTRSMLRKRGLWPRSLPDTWLERDKTPVPNPEAPSEPVAR